MWPLCHFAGVGSWGGFGVAGAVLGALGPLLFLAALAALALWLVRRLPAGGLKLLAAGAPAPAGREIAQARYARGEITRDQYRELLSDLNAGKGGEQ